MFRFSFFFLTNLAACGATQALAEKKRMHEEAKALELKKREELRAGKLQSDAEVFFLTQIETHLGF